MVQNDKCVLDNITLHGHITKVAKTQVWSTRKQISKTLTNTTWQLTWKGN